MTVDDSKKVDAARQDRTRDVSREQPRIRPKETDFDRVMERSRTASQLMPQQQGQSKTITEEAIKEAAKHQDRQGEDGRRDEGDKKDRRESKQRGERSEGKITGDKVVAKGQLKGFGQGMGGGREDGRGGFTAKRSLSQALAKHGAKSVPTDLKGEFAARLSQTLKSSEAQQGVLTQQVLNKIVQYVKIGINRKGEKEIQLELNEKIFRGLKLCVTAHEGGKVGVRLNTADETGRSVLKKNLAAIKDALKKRGIEVDEIVIS